MQEAVRPLPAESVSENTFVDFLRHSELGIIQAARIRAPLHMIQLLVSIYAVVLFVKRSRRLRWALTAIALLELLSALVPEWVEYSRFCFDCGPDSPTLRSAVFEIAWLGIALARPGVRQRFKN